MYTRRSRVRYSEINQKGRLTIASLINYLQDCCAFQSEDLGVGLEYLNERGMGWYITYWEIKIHSLPKMAQEITISTYPSYFKGMFGGRNFIISDSKGNHLVEADSLWILMDLSKQKPQKLSDEIISRYEVLPPLEGQWKGRKIKQLDGFDEVGRLTVMPIHLDTNHHMNNAYYIEIARDYIPDDKKIMGIRCEYKKPALLGDTIVISRAAGDGVVQVKLNSEKDELYCMVEFLL